MNLALSFVALLVERVWGYPKFLQNLIGHPIEWIGAWLQWLDKSFNRPERGRGANKWAGILTLSLYLTLINLVGVTLARFCDFVPFGWVVEGILASALLAQKQLGDMVGAVGRALTTSLKDGRRAVSHLVGRDTRALDEAEVSRAAIETLAENTSDGIVAPLFWLMVFGLPGLVFYKAVNTADSMIGHRNPRYESFGWAAARLDDLLNWIPARLTALLFAWAAPFCRASFSGALAAARRDAPRHVSPNAGWPEAALAGALGFGLGGARTYKGQRLDLPKMGHGRRDLGPADIERALELYRALLNLLAGLVAALAALFWATGHAIY